MNKFFVLILIIVLGFSQNILYAQTQQADSKSEFQTNSSEYAIEGSSEAEHSGLRVDIQSQEVLPYDFSSTEYVPIKLSITKEVSTKDEIVEGQKLEFKVLKDVYYKDKLVVKKDDIVTATLETIVTSGMNGFPAELVVDDFDIPGIKKSQLISTYIKKGQNRCFWVYPLKWALTIIPIAGSLTNFIMGGHARIKTKDVITLYYFPHWR